MCPQAYFVFLMIFFIHCSINKKLSFYFIMMALYFSFLTKKVFQNSIKYYIYKLVIDALLRLYLC